jgi:hypothetical protein
MNNNFIVAFVRHDTYRLVENTGQLISPVRIVGFVNANDKLRVRQQTNCIANTTLENRNQVSNILSQSIKWDV